MGIDLAINSIINKYDQQQHIIKDLLQKISKLEKENKELKTRLTEKEKDR